jgi:hypothetical protein|tara:strand:- start:25316 stop:25441 length:126 start_codon:yes stop_codon:yes gene_type:complete
VIEPLIFTRKDERSRLGDYLTGAVAGGILVAAAYLIVMVAG